MEHPSMVDQVVTFAVAYSLINPMNAAFLGICVGIGVVTGTIILK